MPATVFGLPSHVMIVHFVVVATPLAALATLALALSRRVRSQWRWWVVGIDTIALMAVPLATSSGEALQSRVRETALVEKHVQLAGQLLPVMALLWLTAAGIAVMTVWRERQAAGGATTKRWLTAASTAALVAAVAMSALTVVEIVRIGDAGARAAWTHRFSAHPLDGQR
jgi:predicted membrane protein DUF2231